MANPQIKYNAIIIDPDLSSRARLHQAAHAMRGFGKVVNLNVIQEALEKLRKNRPFDVVFISHRVPREEVLQFIQLAKP